MVRHSLRIRRLSRSRSRISQRFRRLSSQIFFILPSLESGSRSLRIVSAHLKLNADCNEIDHRRKTEELKKMIETTAAGYETQTHLWSQQMQRRIIRLLLQHDQPLFRNQFGRFFVKSTLPQIPLLKQYDRYVKLQTLSNELLDDILPRIRRQLSLKTSHARLREETPTRGDIDWQRTIERGWNLAPGQPALQFDTRLRQRSLETPENKLAVAILLVYRQELQRAMKDSFEDEELSAQEQQAFVSADERAERELAAPYARALSAQARQVEISVLAHQAETHLRPRPHPYPGLLQRWHRFSQFRLGRATDERCLPLASTLVD